MSNDNVLPNAIQKPAGSDLGERLAKLIDKTVDQFDKETLAICIAHIDELRSCVNECARIAAPFIYGPQEIDTIILTKEFVMKVLKPAIDKAAMDWTTIEIEFRKAFEDAGERKLQS